MSPEEMFDPIPHHREDTGADPRNRPYYDAGGFSGIDIIEAYAAGNFLRGTALKYLLRAGKKGDLVSDLRKALWYIEREIAKHSDEVRHDPSTDPQPCTYIPGYCVEREGFLAGDTRTGTLGRADRFGVRYRSNGRSG